MSSSDSESTKNDKLKPIDKTTIKTGQSTYSFSQAWVENEALKDILAGLVADDFKQDKNL